jgi:hypothetical protein
MDGVNPLLQQFDAVIGLKFLRAVSKNPGIYEDVKLKKRPASSTGRSHGQRW